MWHKQHKSKKDKETLEFYYLDKTWEVLQFHYEESYKNSLCIYKIKNIIYLSTHFLNIWSDSEYLL